MSWTNSDLARPDTLYRDHFQRAEERLKVNAHTTLGRHHPVPPITRASDDSALTHAPGQPIARPARDATPGAASSSSKPRTIGSQNGAPLTGQATHPDGHEGLSSALPKPGSPGGEALRQIEALHASMLPPASAKRGLLPPTPTEVTLAQRHARETGCAQCHAFLVGLHRGAAGGRQQVQQEARAQQRSRRSTPQTSRNWPPRI